MISEISRDTHEHVVQFAANPRLREASFVREIVEEGRRGYSAGPCDLAQRRASDTLVTKQPDRILNDHGFGFLLFPGSKAGLGPVRRFVHSDSFRLNH